MQSVGDSPRKVTIILSCAVGKIVSNKSSRGKLDNEEEENKDMLVLLLELFWKEKGDVTECRLQRYSNTNKTAKNTKKTQQKQYKKEKVRSNTHKFCFDTKTLTQNETQTKNTQQILRTDTSSATEIASNRY